jgi:hypothetical protein
LTATVDWSTWYKPHTCPMSPPPHQVWDLHNTTTTTHFQHSDDAQKSGISKKTVNPISPNKARENKIAGNKTQRLLFHPKTKRSPTQSLSISFLWQETRFRTFSFQPKEEIFKQIS